MNMLSYEEALERILQHIKPGGAERCDLDNALGRFTREPLHSKLDLPPWDNSSMDGYAVQSADLVAASQGNPVSLKVVGEAPAGALFQQPIASGECVRIFTGSPLPPGADAVVMQEDTRTPTSAPGCVEVLDKVTPWENVRFRGQDIKAGEQLLCPGDEMHAGRVALVAAAGCAQVVVGNRLKVGLLATGSELAEPGATLQPGHIYESNRAGLAARVSQLQCTPIRFPIIQDDFDATRKALVEALANCDCLLTTGGVSVGAYDYLKSAFEAEGGRWDFWRVSIKPGKPFVFGERAGKFLFGLPGNPVSAIVTFHLLVRPAILRMMGASDVNPPAVPGTLGETLSNTGDRRHFVRVLMDTTGRVVQSGPQASHMIKALALANGLVDVPPRTILQAGTNVQVLRLH